MNFRNLLLAACAASVTFRIVSQKDRIAKEAKETKELLTTINANKNNIKDQLAIIQELQSPLQDMTKDLQHKIRVYQQSIAGNLEEIQKIRSKYAKQEE